MKTKQPLPHSPGCHAVKNYRNGTWNTPWAYLQTCVYRDSIGRDIKGGSRRWWLVPCNDPDCRAVLHVSEDSILEACNAGTSSASPEVQP